MQTSSLTIREKKLEMAKQFNSLVSSMNQLSESWQDWFNGQDFEELFPFTESFDEVALKVKRWSEQCITNLERIEPLSFYEFREQRTTYIVEEFIERFGADNIHETSPNDIGLVYTYEDGLHIEAMRDGKFFLGIENMDWYELDLLELERKLYRYYLLDKGASLAEEA